MKHNYRAFKEAVMESKLENKETMLNCMEWNWDGQWDGQWDVWGQFTPEQEKLASEINELASLKMWAWSDEHEGHKCTYAVAKKYWKEAIERYENEEIELESWDGLDGSDLDYDNWDCFDGSDLDEEK